MSLRPHNVSSGNDTPAAQPPEIQHPTPTRPPALRRRVTIATETYEQHSTWSHSVVTMDSPNSGRPDQNGEEPPATATATNIQRPPSAPAVMCRLPIPPPAIIHPVLTVPPALRASTRPRVRLTWDVRFPPDAPPSALIALGRRKNTVPHPTHSTRPRSNTNPVDLEQNLSPTLASGTRRRPNFDSKSPASARPSEGEIPQAFTIYPVASEPATFPPRARMLVICRDLLTWLIPIYAHDPEVGCTVLDVVRGIYEALQVKVEVPGRSRSTNNDILPVRERRRVEWLHDKTIFVCLERDEALVKRRLPGNTGLWEETFVLTLTRRRE